MRGGPRLWSDVSDRSNLPPIDVLRAMLGDCFVASLLAMTRSMEETEVKWFWKILSLLCLLAGIVGMTVSACLPWVHVTLLGLVETQRLYGYQSWPLVGSLVGLGFASFYAGVWGASRPGTPRGTLLLACGFAAIGIAVLAWERIDRQDITLFWGSVTFVNVHPALGAFFLLGSGLFVTLSGVFLILAAPDSSLRRPAK